MKLTSYPSSVYFTPVGFVCNGLALDTELTQGGEITSYLLDFILLHSIQGVSKSRGNHAFQSCTCITRLLITCHPSMIASFLPCDIFFVEWALCRAQHYPSNLYSFLLLATPASLNIPFLFLLLEPHSNKTSTILCWSL